MLAVEAAIYQAIIDKGITPDVTAGLSLGEYGALIASGAMTMADAFAVVRKMRNLHAGGSSYRWSHDSGFRT